ncbi:hypothetical protein B6I56_26785 [Klebsiella quasipneumoniae]|nr:hypothetical protein B6I56_26785 [Klebsiella quasipneumoniae]PLF81461.1 hypothetical protein B6I98_27185 [Klebsiella quasipneumoniae]PLJ75038.1 hypothetical protein B6J71_09115 [Klebsiella quasipneumoniae]PLM18585.1 hypothetical protein CWN58_27590 [Klebsiella quasipneumoniae]
MHRSQTAASGCRFFIHYPGLLKRFSAGLTHQIWPALSGSTSKISSLPALSHKMNSLTKSDNKM